MHNIRGVKEKGCPSITSTKLHELFCSGAQLGCERWEPSFSSPFFPPFPSLPEEASGRPANGYSSYMNFISLNTAAQYNVEGKIEIQNIQVIQKKLYKVIRKNPS